MDGGAARTLRVRIPAKINLHLAVGPRRADGYHDVVTVLQTVSIYDTLRLQMGGDAHSAHPAARRRMRVGLTLDADGHTDGIPANGDNLALVAASRLMEHLGMHSAEGIDVGAGADEVARGDDAARADAGPTTRMHLTKRIPIAAGMAGGSADAAAALVGLNRLWEVDLDAETLCDVAASVGSDVPFCVLGGSALATGTGTSVARVLTRGSASWVVGIDRAPLSTADVYAAFDRLEPPTPSTPDAVLQALRIGDLEGLAASLRNDLEPAAVTLRPQIAERREAMLRAGALATLVSGSGPTLLGLARDALHARRIAAEVERHFDAVEVAVSPAGGPELLSGRAA
jgi:4-diphosphocytidyl-2-C-methyl-D-erythritol kinase